MRRQIVVLSLVSALSGCGAIGALAPPSTALGQAGNAEGQTRPVARPGGLNSSAVAPPETARTVEDFDTTTAAERQAAASSSSGAAEQLLGVTVVSLGDPAKPGFWLETPLVTSPITGRVAFPDTGQSSQVELIPIDGPSSAGSRMSLAAMRVIGVPLTGLVEVQVFSGG